MSDDEIDVQKKTPPKARSKTATRTRTRKAQLIPPKRSSLTEQPREVSDAPQKRPARSPRKNPALKETAETSDRFPWLRLVPLEFALVIWLGVALGWRDVFAGEPLVHKISYEITLLAILTAVIAAYVFGNWFVRNKRKILLASFPALVAMYFFATPVSNLVLHGVMYMFGYSRCDAIEDDSFNWIRNPEWCVRGKDRAWVLEQARIASEAAAKK
jgi:hypothetical protein